MANPGDYNPFIPPEYLSNDHKQARITFYGMAFAVVIAALLILAMFR